MDVRHIPELANYRNPAGRCRMLHLDNRSCLIYAERPLVCNVDAMGKLIRLTPGSWRLVNRNSCHVLHEQQLQAPLEAIGERCRHAHPETKALRDRS